VRDNQLWHQQVELYDDDIFVDDFLGRQSVDVANLEPGSTFTKTVSFGPVRVKHFLNLSIATSLFSSDL